MQPHVTLIPRARLAEDLAAVYAEARARLEAQVAADPADRTARRWLAALGRAWATLEALTELPFTDLGTDHPGLLLASTSTPGTSYTANGVCQCTAYHNGQPCDHRAASRLARLALDRALAAARAAETPEQAERRRSLMALARIEASQPDRSTAGRPARP